MEIEIKPDIFEGTDFADLRKLIVDLTYKDRYPVIVDLAKVQNTALFKRLDFDDKQVLIENFNNYISTSNQLNNASPDSLGCEYSVTYHSNSDKELNLEEAIHYFNQSISILVENSLNDSYFLEALFRLFDETGKLTKYKDNKWISIDNAGGCKNYINYITAEKNKFSRYPKPPHLYLRIFVFLDGDRLNDVSAIDINHIKLVGFLNENDIRYHITEKRTMENYMPCGVLPEFSENNNAEWISAYNYLSPKQKDFLNISGGFTKKGSNNIPSQTRDQLQQEVKDLYGDVSETNFNIIDKGLKIDSFKANFPVKFRDSHSVYKESLLERTAHQKNPNELNDIVQKIISLI